MRTLVLSIHLSAAENVTHVRQHMMPLCCCLSIFRKSIRQARFPENMKSTIHKSPLRHIILPFQSGSRNVARVEFHPSMTRSTLGLTADIYESVWNEKVDRPEKQRQQRGGKEGGKEGGRARDGLVYVAVVGSAVCQRRPPPPPPPPPRPTGSHSQSNGD